MKINIFLIYVVVFTLLFSCKKEDELSPSGADIDYFLPAENDMSSEAELKRNFFDNNNVRLLFSDTVYVSEVDTIVVNYDYNYTVNYTGLTYIVDKITNIEDQTAAADFISESIIKKIGSVPPPYSVLLTKDFMSLQLSWGFEILTPIATLPSLKTTVINVGDIQSKEDWEKVDLANSVLSQYLGEQLSTNYVSELKEFFDVSSFIYDDIWNSYPTYTESDMINGFIDIPEFNYTRKFDIKSYLYQMYTYSEEDFRAMYGNYDNIITKMEALNRILKDEFNIVIYQ